MFGLCEMFTLELYDRLWDQYRQRVSYVRTYEEIIQQHGATFFNDHIALRTIALQVVLTIHHLHSKMLTLVTEATPWNFLDFPNL